MTADALIPAKPHELDEPPEHRNDRRRFLIWACMAGFVPPERVTERIVAEVDSEHGDAEP